MDYVLNVLPGTIPVVITIISILACAAWVLWVTMTRKKIVPVFFLFGTLLLAFSGFAAWRGKGEVVWGGLLFLAAAFLFLVWHIHPENRMKREVKRQEQIEETYDLEMFSGTER